MLRMAGVCPPFLICPSPFSREASTLRHSCAANVDVCRERGSSMMTITARFTINPQTRIGAWLIGDTSIWWKGANVRSEALQACGAAPWKSGDGRGGHSKAVVCRG